MGPSDRIPQAAGQLDRVLQFFPRVESKAATLFALDAGLLGLMCLNLQPDDLPVWYIMVPGALAVVLLGASLWFVYRCIFPHLDGGGGSVIYFREIATRTEAKYVDEYLATTEDAYTKDLLGQVWRNSDILRIKFDAVKWAFICSALALVPWCVFLAATAITHAKVPTIS